MQVASGSGKTAGKTSGNIWGKTWVMGRILKWEGPRIFGRATSRYQGSARVNRQWEGRAARFFTSRFHSLWVGLCGTLATLLQLTRRTMITRDILPLRIVVINPAPGVLAPIVQVQGYVSETLFAL